MSRFRIASLAALLGVVAILALVEGPARAWAVAALLAAYLVTLGLGVAFAHLGFFCDALCRGRPGRRRIALTFDDGPDPGVTPALLDALRRHNARATFFCIGENAQKHPAIVARVAEEGHALGNHTFQHAWWTNFLFGRRLRKAINDAQSAIANASGRTAPKYFRSPMGLTNPHLKSALQEAGLALVGWDVRPLDRRRPPEAVVAHVLKKVRDGSIVLLHDGRARRHALLAAVNEIIARLKKRGYAFVTLDELAEKPEPPGSAQQS